MPRISEFFGIIIYMYWYDTKQHKQPHFHAYHGGNMAVFSLQGKCISGNLGRRATRLVQEWARERQRELKNAWMSAKQGKEIPWIKPIN